MKYLKIAEASKKWGLSTRRVCVLCAEAKRPEDG